LWNATSISSTNKARLRELDAMFKAAEEEFDCSPLRTTAGVEEESQCN
jgi:hypothetical protein